jgi:hypothetical protein
LLAVAGFVFAATVVTMPGALTDYLHRMPPNLHFMQVEHAYLWERHITLKAFWRLLVQGRGPGETAPVVVLLTAVSATPFAAALCRLALRARRGSVQADAVITATVMAGPLLMPFYFDYDLLLLAVPAALAAGFVTRAGSRIHLVCGSALYLWLFVNPYVGPAVRLNLAVPLLAGVTTLSLRRALRSNAAEATDLAARGAAQPPLAPSRMAA